MSKKINRKDLFINIYNNIRNKEEKYYVPIINNGNNPSLQDVFDGTERFFFLENGLYFISENVVDAYKSIFPKNLIFISIDENEFNLILEEICMKQLPTKPIAIVENEKIYIVEKSSILVNWLNENFENREKKDINIKYIDFEENMLNIKNKKEKKLKEKSIITSIVIILILLKVLFLYVSYLFSFNILSLSGFIAFLILGIVFVFLNSLSDIVIKGILNAITN